MERKCKKKKVEARKNAEEDKSGATAGSRQKTVHSEQPAVLSLQVADNKRQMGFSEVKSDGDGTQVNSEVTHQ